MKRFFVALLIAALLFCSVVPTSATGDPNIDGGGGSGMDGSGGGNGWNPGNDGVRVTIVRASDNSPVSNPMDFSNATPSKTAYHFGKVSKLSYTKGTKLGLKTTDYNVVYPATPMPQIISPSGGNNIEAIRTYFCSEGAIKNICKETNFNYNLLVGGKYKILIEPIAYFSFGDFQFAMTAHEASMYDQLVSGQLRSAMGNLTHKNQPLSLFLQYDDMGFPAWSGSTSDYVNNHQIQSSLGLGIVRFDEGPPLSGGEPGGSGAIETWDYDYRCDTDVITSVIISSQQGITPANPATVTFTVNGTTHTHSGIVLPEGGSQHAFFKWHTPVDPATVTIQVSSSRGSIEKGTITAKIVDLDENPPPDPRPTDRNDGFVVPAVPSHTDVKTLTWGEWEGWWQENWEWEEKWVKVSVGCDSSCNDGCASSHKEWVDKGKWVDNGWYEYEWIPYTATISASMSVSPDEMAPTASGKTMASGYGINLDASSHIVSTAPGSHYSPLQNVVSYYPEFDYESYWRLCERFGSGLAFTFQLKENPYSMHGQRVQFTPVWFPDGNYTVYAHLLDAWTPAGMLEIHLTDAVQIKGSLYDDWFIGKK